jgi:Carboxylesterase family
MKQILTLFLIGAVLTGCTKSVNTGKEIPGGDTTTGLPLSNITNIEYGSNTDTSGKMVSLVMDIYFPENAKTGDKNPLVMMLHGGSYLNGDKTDLQRDCQILADSGFVVASINYRVGWRSGTTTCGGDSASETRAGYRALQDANAALRFLTFHYIAFSINTDWVFVGGSSAGSSLALNTTYISDPIAMVFLPTVYAQLGSVSHAGNSLTNGFNIKGICNMWGALPDSNLISEFSATPTISFHGTSDNVVPYDIGYNESCTNYAKLFGSACIHRRLVVYHTPVISNFVIGGGHGPSVYTPEFLMGNTACFFKKIMYDIPITSAVYTTLVNTCN